MNRIATTVICCAFAVLVSACPQKESKQPNSGDVAAVVNGVTITMREVDDAAKSQLQKVQTQIYQIRKRVLDDLMEGKLVEAGAKKQNLSVNDFLAQEVEAKVTDPTDKEIYKILKTALMVVGKDDFCMEYITAFREGKLE